MYFSAFTLLNAREGQSLWCALTRKYGEVARGSHSWAGRQFAGLCCAVRRGDVLLIIALTNNEQLRMELHCCILVFINIVYV